MKSEFYKKKVMLIILMLLLSSVGKKTFAVRMYASLHEFLEGGMWRVIIITGNNIGERKKNRQHLKTLRKFESKIFFFSSNRNFVTGRIIHKKNEQKKMLEIEPGSL